jgi:hypothetical protein
MSAAASGLRQEGEAAPRRHPIGPREQDIAQVIEPEHKRAPIASALHRAGPILKVIACLEDLITATD